MSHVSSPVTSSFKNFFHLENLPPHRYYTDTLFIIIQEPGIDVVTHIHDSSSWLKIYSTPFRLRILPYHVIVLKRKFLEVGIFLRELNFYFRSQAPSWSCPQPLENSSGPPPSYPPLDPLLPSSLDFLSMQPLSFLVSSKVFYGFSRAEARNHENDQSAKPTF